MAVLVEGISVIVRVAAIFSKFEGGLDGFKQGVPNKTLCIDNELARVGFMSPMDVESYVQKLEAKGLRFLVDGNAADLAVVDQQRGLTSPCSWVEIGKVDLNPGQPVSAARLLGSQERRLWTPDGWMWDESLSSRHVFVPNEDVDASLKYLGTTDNVDMYLDPQTGEKRLSRPDHSERSALRGPITSPP